MLLPLRVFVVYVLIPLLWSVLVMLIYRRLLNKRLAKIVAGLLTELLERKSCIAVVDSAFALHFIEKKELEDLLGHLIEEIEPPIEV